MPVPTQKDLIITLESKEVDSLDNILELVYPALKSNTPEMELLIKLIKSVYGYKKEILNNN